MGEEREERESGREGSAAAPCVLRPAPHSPRRCACCRLRWRRGNRIQCGCRYSRIARHFCFFFCILLLPASVSAFG
ncbi:uncharacterized protein DS421_14g469970 [Arachis hypogaea]|nr:uncharacterized protein DS421_14g469970 [Arachis hypogaea]